MGLRPKPGERGVIGGEDGSNVDQRSFFPDDQPGGNGEDDADDLDDAGFEAEEAEVVGAVKVPAEGGAIERVVG